MWNKGAMGSRWVVSIRFTLAGSVPFQLGPTNLNCRIDVANLWDGRAQEPSGTNRNVTVRENGTFTSPSRGWKALRLVRECINTLLHRLRKVHLLASAMYRAFGCERD